jgi:1-aminocyclopropane-1-carboxylate deaminase/D-cysteine desulfhydrase-like pyridoxal-dependent ACC family enzyme
MELNSKEIAEARMQVVKATDVPFKAVGLTRGEEQARWADWHHRLAIIASEMHDLWRNVFAEEQLELDDILSSGRHDTALIQSPQDF